MLIIKTVLDEATHRRMVEAEPVPGSWLPYAIGEARSLARKLECGVRLAFQKHTITVWPDDDVRTCVYAHWQRTAYDPNVVNRELLERIIDKAEDLP
jgi:hypothetical protein